MQELASLDLREKHTLKKLNFKFKNPEREEVRVGDLSGLQMEFSN